MMASLDDIAVRSYPQMCDRADKSRHLPRNRIWSKLSAAAVATALLGAACASADSSDDDTTADSDADTAVVDYHDEDGFGLSDQPGDRLYEEDVAAVEEPEYDTGYAATEDAMDAESEAYVQSAPSSDMMAEDSPSFATEDSQSREARKRWPAPPPWWEPPPDAVFGGNQFEDYGINPPVDAHDDPLSTFSLDVDTGSYTVVRNFIRSGVLPPPEAVRVEEFVNYFGGEYRVARDQFTVTLDVASSPFSYDKHLLRVGVQAPVFSSDAIEPDSIVLVVDRSGSMQELAGYADGYWDEEQALPRYRLVHEAIFELVRHVDPETRIGVVAYSDYAETVLDPVAAGDNQRLIRSIVRDEIYPTNSTNVEAGLVHGYDMALREAERGRNVLVMLLSDGVANVGHTRTGPILESLGDRDDIGLSTIGVGLGPFNDELMEQLANNADGSYRYIDTIFEARRLMQEGLIGLLTVAAEEARIQVEFDPSVVRSYRLLGFENRDLPDDAFRDDTRDSGEIGLGQSATALYEVEFHRACCYGRETIATATLRYRRPRSNEMHEVVTTIHGDYITRFAQANFSFRVSAVAAQFAELLRRSPYVTRDGVHALGALASSMRVPGEAKIEELGDLVLEGLALLGREYRWDDDDRWGDPRDWGWRMILE